MPRLLLFDIDGTLIDTGGAGGQALLDAVEDTFGVARHTLAPLELAGATDGGITRQIFEQTGRPHEASAVAAYHRSYIGHLRRRLGDASFAGVVLPGAHELLLRLAVQADVHVGLLTGNVREGAEIKLRRFGIWDHFADGAFGDDAEDRNLLGPVALARMERHTGLSFDPADVIVIGDTPKDISCAAAFGARCLAVATGKFNRNELAAHSPFVVAGSLEDDVVMELLCQG